jgi:hypothetical protein
MKFKSFKEFINENFRSALPRVGKMGTQNIDVNFYFEKITEKTFDIQLYLNSFANKETFNFLDRPKFLRFILIYYNNNYYCFVFNGKYGHGSFIEMIEKTKDEDNFIKDIQSYEDVYFSAYTYGTKVKSKKFLTTSMDITDDEKLEELKTMWCLLGVYDKGQYQSWGSERYLELLAKLGVPEKLGFDYDTWKSLYEI